MSVSGDRDLVPGRHHGEVSAVGLSPIRGLVRALASVVAVLALIGAWAPKAFSQAKYPNRPIRLLVPFAPGGGVDVVARIVGQKVSEHLGQAILVESKPGGGGATAVGELMRSEPDGYTLLMTTSAHATLPKLNKLAWHPSNDFAPIASIYSYMFVIATKRYCACPAILRWIAFSAWSGS